MDTSRDWGHELVQSLIWLSWVFPLTFVVSAVIIALLLRTTKWGHQVWRVSGGFFRGPDAWPVYALLALLLAFSLFSVRMNVLFSYWSNDFYNSLQFSAQAIATKDDAALDRSVAFFWSSLGLFGILAAIHVVRALIAYYIGEAFEIRWRLWLTDHVTADWLTGNAYYRNRFIDDTIDNPDQRIQADVTSFVSSSRSLAFGAISSVVTIFAFIPVLWNLSGTLNVLGLTIPRAMMWLVLAYVIITTVIAFYLGRPLIRLNFLYEAVTANFRYALVRVRDGAENIAFYRGENVERIGLFSRFRAVIEQYWRIVYRTLKFDGWNLSVNQLAVIFPWLIQGPRFFQGQVTFGDVTQTASAFGEIHDSLSFFREAYDEFAAYRASTIRLHGLLVADEESRELPKIAKSEADGVQLTNVDVRRPDGVLLVDDLDLRLVAGEALVVKGASGSGKTTLLRTLAQIWPYADGAIAAPIGNETLFLSQIPYLPLGDLRTAVAYPAEASDIDDDLMRATLTKVSLPHLVDKLDVADDWSKVLSPGEQQRIAFARILLIRPAVVFLDEATSAIDEGLEHALYQLIRSELPETILVSVAGDDLSVIGSGPGIPDPSTWADAAVALERFQNLEYPPAVRARMAAGLGGDIPDTPKPGSRAMAKASGHVIATRRDALQAAKQAAESRGYRVVVLDEFIAGEARRAAVQWYEMLQSLLSSTSEPICALSSGETTVHVVGDGTGGRNQEFALALVEVTSRLQRDVVIASVGTDGIDGPTDAAGALVDRTSRERAAALGMEPNDYLDRNDSFAFFEGLGDLIRTGRTDTNVGDLQVLLAR